MRPYIHSSLNKKVNEGFPRKMKQVSILHTCTDRDFVSGINALMRQWTDRGSTAR